MIARAAAIDHVFPSIGSLSLAQGRYPFGETAYGYGSLLIDYIARTRGPQHVRDFVEKSAADIIPYLVDVPAKQGFGITFSRAWHEFSDSVARSIREAATTPAPGWRELTKDGTWVFAPRWIGDTAITYTGTPGRESFSAYRIDLNGKRKQIGRRNSRGANVPLGNDEYLYAQLDYTNPYQQRSDLWVQSGRHEHQLTFDKRLATPDVRKDGLIVATQITPGATRLVLVSRDGKTITPITSGSYDEQWTEPRWSHDGKHIAASRWLRGDIAQIVVVDTAGHLERTISSSHSIEATPSWATDDSGIFYSSDRTGEAQVYYRRLDSQNEYRVSSAATGLFEPQLAPDGGSLTSVFFRGDGYHLGVFPCCDSTRGRWTSVTPQRAESQYEPAIIDTSRARKFSPWRTFVPRYWLPTINDGIDGGYRVGGVTSGVDVIGRHAITAGFQLPTNNRGGWTGSFNYQYAGLGLPIIQVNGSQDWESLGGIFARNAARERIGELFRRTSTGEALATWLRQRARTSLSVTGGFGLEHRTHVTTGGVPVASIDSGATLGSPTYPSLIASASFANYQRPPFSISQEDGIQLGVTVRDRIQSGLNGEGPSSYSTVGAASLFKSINLPGFAHHVIALHASAGYADDNAAGYFSVGGINGGQIQVIPGYVLGEGSQTFPVRGFSPSTLIGTRALSGSAEYRIPLWMIENAPGPLPLFFDRGSVSLFGDIGSAWCPDVKIGREVCNIAGDPNLTRPLTLASFGGEININVAALTWDSPYRFRLGVAVPTQNAVAFGRNGVQFYFVTGIGF